MITLLQPTNYDLPFTFNFSLDCYTAEEICEDIKELVQESALRRLTISFSPKNGFTGHAVTGHVLSPDFVEKYNLPIKHLKR